MRLTRIFVESTLASGDVLLLPPGPAQHLSRVLRLQAGAALRVFNGRGGEFDATIESQRRDTVTLRISARHAIERESPLQITLLQGIARGEKMDLILQKATELGIHAVVPVTTVRSTVKLEDKTALRKQAHWQGVVIGACEQSGRNRVPAVATPITLAAAVAADPSSLKLLLAPDDSAGTLNTLLQSAARTHAAMPISLLVGPEGGFDPQEIEAAKQAGFQPCRLGPRVLRTETAALTALAALQSLAGDLT
jgi:16S rRNA (uracil1498-N3)-methyltransferase